MNPELCRKPLFGGLGELGKEAGLKFAAAPIKGGAAKFYRRPGDYAAKNPAPLLFEAAVTLSAGRSVLARLEPSRNRWTLEPSGTVSQAEVDAVAPALFQQLADRSGLPVRAMGLTYKPRYTPRPDATIWGRA